MSEDEIIKRINYVIDNWYDENLEIDCRWIEGLLDLYNKQKEQIKELEEELERQINTRIINEEFIENNFISKNKIKEKIEELEEGYTDEVGFDIDARYYNQFIVDCVAILEELLEEK